MGGEVEVVPTKTAEKIKKDENLKPKVDDIQKIVRTEDLSKKEKKSLVDNSKLV